MSIKPISFLPLIFLFVAHLSFAAPAKTSETTYLKVYNNWFQTVHVKEGWILKNEQDVFSGGHVEWVMFGGSVSNLNISYKQNGNWVQIPGCPIGNYSHGLTVYISAAPWDPNVPVCHQV